jgi:hypothetical protein
MVTTGPKISSDIVLDSGSVVKMMVGSTKYPFDLSQFPPAIIVHDGSALACSINP